MRSGIRTATLMAAVLGGGCAARAPAATNGEAVTLSAADAVVRIAPDSGRVVSIRVGAAREEMARRHPAYSEAPFAFVEVADLRGGRTYSPLVTPSTVSAWKVAEGPRGKSVTFVQQYAGAPLRIAHTLRETPAGVRWTAAIRLAAGEKLNRSVRVGWMLPLPYGWRFWGPNDVTSVRTDGVTPHRYVYGHTDPRPYAVVIPLVGVWGRRGGAAVFSPPDARKCQITFDVYTQNVADPPRGVTRSPADLQTLRVAHHMVGLRPGKDLTLSVCIAGARPDWRGVMGRYAGSYPELFEPVPAARKYEGAYAIGNASRFDRQVGPFKAHGATFAEIHGHFPEYGVYVTPEAVADPALTWRCKPHRAGVLSLAHNRKVIRQALDAGIAPFMYFYNVHANTQTARRLWAEDLMKTESGKLGIQYRGEPALRAVPDSGFGKHLIEQMDLMLRAYPKAPGFFVDNYVQQWVSFAHDDGLTMVHNRPCYDMNLNHQVIGPIVFDKAHKAGKVIMVNKLATIESARGADMVLVEHMTVDSLKVHAFACLYRSVFPLKWSHPRPHALERGLQYLLLYGGTASETLFDRDPATYKAYRPVVDAMIGKRWVLDHPDPLTVPPGWEGQIFRIDPHAPRGGSVVVSMVNLNASWRDAAKADGLVLRVRLPEADKLTQAVWLAPAADGKVRPVPREIDRTGGVLRIALPPVAAAGVLRLSR